MNTKNAYRQKLGHLGEELTATYLEQHGYEILQRNYRCRFGEIDIIARKGNILHFIEVKTRSSGAYGTPAESITGKKLRNLRLTLGDYLAEQAKNGELPIGAGQIQLDAAEIQINHIQNI